MQVRSGWWARASPGRVHRPVRLRISCRQDLQFRVRPDGWRHRSNRSIAECRGTVGSVIARNCYSGFALESASVLKIGYFEDDNYLTTNRKVILLNGCSHIEVERVLLQGLGGQNLFETLDTSVFTCRHLHIRTAAMPNFGGQVGRHITESLPWKLRANCRKYTARRKARGKRSAST